MTETSRRGIGIVLHPVTDLARATAVYRALLGVEPIADSEYYVGFEVAGQHLGLVPGDTEHTGPVTYWWVDDIEASLSELTAAGATVTEKPRTVGPGRTVATITDPDGNVVGLVHDD